MTVGESVYPKGEVHKDDYFGEQEVFRGTFKVTAPLSGAKAGDTLALKLKWQGCADAGLCYPPSVWDATVKVAAAAHQVTADKIFSERPKAQADGDEEFVDPDVAFVLTADAKSPNNVQLNWRIADGYYLYKKRITLAPADAARPVGALVLPKGLPHSDEYFGEQEVYRQSLDASFSVPPSASKTVDVKVTYQGCADAGLCYPPQTKSLSISLEGAPTTSVTFCRGQRRLRVGAGQVHRATQRQYPDRHRAGLPGRLADVVHTLRAADGADSHRYHCGRRGKTPPAAAAAAFCWRWRTSAASPWCTRRWESSRPTSAAV